MFTVDNKQNKKLNFKLSDETLFIRGDLKEQQELQVLKVNKTVQEIKGVASELENTAFEVF